MENLNLINHRIEIVLLFLCCLLFACNNCNPDKYGLELNAMRNKIGLVEIEPNWELESKEGCSFVWSNSNSSVLHKKIVRTNGSEQPRIEEDLYYTGKYSQMDLDQPTLEQDYVSVMYFFEQGEWDVTHHGKDDFINQYEFDQKIELCYYDYLHFELGVQWKYLPKVDTTLFPLRKKQNLNS